MMSSDPCSACSWTVERQKACRYKSHVQLFYGCSDRGVWSLGSKLILKERGTSHRGYEVPNLRFINNKTTIPVPAVVEDWEEEDHTFTLLRRMPGETLHEAWPKLTDNQKEKIAKETAEHLTQLRKLQSDKIQALDGRPIYNDFLFLDSGLPHGPFSSAAELWDDMARSLEGIPDAARDRFRSYMPPAEPYTFTHSDLTDVNIMVENGHLTGIIDWELSGYFPVWWEYVCTTIGDSDEDRDWKALLRKYMHDDYTDAREFWLDYYHLSEFPESERSKALLREVDEVERS